MTRVLLNCVKLIVGIYVCRPFRGYGRLMRSFGNFFGKHAVVRNVNGFDFSFDLFDPYWNLLLSKSYVYEPEVKAFLSLELESNPTFIDCGANYGYWTLYALKRIESRKCLSIEASPITFLALQKNVTLNQKNPVLINAALTSTDGQLVGVATYGENHAGASIEGMKELVQTNVTMVETISLKAVLARFQVGSSFLIKLDVFL